MCITYYYRWYIHGPKVFFKVESILALTFRSGFRWFITSRSEGVIAPANHSEQAAA